MAVGQDQDSVSGHGEKKADLKEMQRVAPTAVVDWVEG